MNKKITISFIAKIGMLAAVSVLVMMFEIPLWFAPGFYKLDLSSAVVLIGGFALGPIAAIFIELIKILLNFLIDGSITAGIGELANFIMGVSFALPATYIYKRNKTVKSAVVGMIVGTVSLAVIGALMNMYVLLPVYAAAFSMPISALVEMGSALNSNITDITSLVLLATTPFNIIKGVLSSLIALALYKRLSPILHK